MPRTLTPREQQVVRLASLGCTSNEAAAILKIATSTVSNHKARAMTKLGVDKVPLLVRVALKHRVTTLNDQLTPAEKRKCGRKNDGWN